MNAARPTFAGRFDAIAIGTSAGGIEALMQLLPALPARAALAVFVVIHLPRDRNSLLVHIFGPKCRMLVAEAADKERVAPGTVYFAPPDYHLLVDTGPQLALSIDELVNYSRPSIDVLFESAADVYGDRLLGVVLTGGNHDGAAGLAAIERAGGMAVVQEPADAQVAMMPLAALKRVPAAEVMTLPQLAAMFAGLDAPLDGAAP